MTAVAVTSTTVSTSWRNRAACRGLDPQLFFPAPGESAAAARAVCAGCPVKADCAETALFGHAEHYGIWGGLSAHERRRIRRARRRAIEQGPMGRNR